jgi:hypothetical protein
LIEGQRDEAFIEAKKLSELRYDELLIQLGIRIEDMKEIGGYHRAKNYYLDSSIAELIDASIDTEKLREIGLEFFTKFEEKLRALFDELGGRRYLVEAGANSVPEAAALLATVASTHNLAPPTLSIVATTIIAQFLLVTRALAEGPRYVRSRRREATKDETEAEPPAEMQEANFVNFAFTDVTRDQEHKELIPYEGFLSEHTYWFTASIGLEPDIRFGVKTEQPEVERPAVEGEVDLYVALFAEKDSPIQVVGKPLDVITWPEKGPSTKDAKFTLEVSSVNEERHAQLDILFYHKLSLIYNARITITIQPRGYEYDPAGDGYPITWYYDEEEQAYRTKLFYGFTATNSIMERGLNLAIQRSSRSNEYVLTAFMGAAELPARIEMTVDECNDFLLKIRNVLDDFRKEQVFVDGGYDEGGTYVGAYIGHLDGFTRDHQPITALKRQAIVTKYMNRMARLGSRFYQAVFGTESARTLSHAIEEALEEGDIIQIWIDKDARDFVFPWAWLYTEPVDPTRRFKAKKERFWGYRYIIEQTPQFPEVIGIPMPRAIPYDSLDIKIGVWNFESFTNNQKQYFKECNTKSGGVVRYELWDEDTQWERYLRNCDSPLLYFFSHGHTAKPTTIASEQFYDMVSALKTWADTRSPDESEGMKQYRQRLIQYLEELEDSDLLSETFIRLNRGYIFLDELASMNLAQSKPLVFLNMCESAQIFPNISKGLIDTFLRRQARGVLGTEIPMIPSFADLYAREFFEALFHGRDAEGNPLHIGKVLFDLRRRFLDLGNPLGFAYTYYGDATMFVQH